jgi:hypothetical protein
MVLLEVVVVVVVGVLEVGVGVVRMAGEHCCAKVRVGGFGEGEGEEKVGFCGLMHRMAERG